MTVRPEQLPSTGRLGYQVLGEEGKFADAGELVVWPAGAPHKWWNAGTTELRTRAWCKPPDNIEFFLGALFDAAFLMTRYRSEYGMLELPAFVRRVVIPMLFVVGRVLGKHDKYRDAPEPTRKRPVPTTP